MQSELILLGIIGGFLGGLLGVGGGTIYVPALVLIYHLGQQTAQGISLAVMVPMAALGSYAYFRQGSLRKDIFWSLAISSVLGALLGAALANTLGNLLLKQIFSVAIFLLGLKMALGK